VCEAIRVLESIWGLSSEGGEVKRGLVAGAVVEAVAGRLDDWFVKTENKGEGKSEYEAQ
jgi:hypothetical protein